MRTSRSKLVLFLGASAIALSACSSMSPSVTPVSTRAATQTPWIIQVPVTVTPEPATVTPLPIATEPRPVRTPTRPPVAKPTAIPTKAASPVPAPPSPTAPPACSLGTVTLREPNDGAERRTKAVGIGGDTFRFIWEPPPSLQAETDASTGYRLEMTAKRGSNYVNGATLFISHNKFLRDNKLFIFDKPNVSALANGDDVTVTWHVTIVKASGSFNEMDPSYQPPGIVTCGSPSPTWKINLMVFE